METERGHDGGAGHSAPAGPGGVGTGDAPCACHDHCDGTARDCAAVTDTRRAVSLTYFPRYGRADAARVIGAVRRVRYDDGSLDSDLISAAAYHRAAGGDAAGDHPDVCGRAGAAIGS